MLLIFQLLMNYTKSLISFNNDQSLNQANSRIFIIYENDTNVVIESFKLMTYIPKNLIVHSDHMVHVIHLMNLLKC